MVCTKQHLIITIDGPAGAGKSTVASQVAQDLHYEYLDTGAMYRALTYKVLEQGLNPQDEEGILSLLKTMNIILKKGKLYNHDENLTPHLREEKVDREVSQVSSLARVRKYMVEMQREIGKKGGFVVDGRDAGTCIFPEADMKIFLSASPMIRGKRRYLEMEKKNIHCSLPSIVQAMKQRDYKDSSRKDSPLKPASDAIYIDTSHLSKTEVVQAIVTRARELMR